MKTITFRDDPIGMAKGRWLYLLVRPIHRIDGGRGTTLALSVELTGYCDVTVHGRSHDGSWIRSVRSVEVILQTANETRREYVSPDSLSEFSDGSGDFAQTAELFEYIDGNHEANHAAS